MSERLTREQIEQCRANPMQAMIRREELCDMALSSLSDGWVSVEERLPDVDVRVQWFFPHGVIQIWQMDKNMDWQWVKDTYGDVAPTHWRDIPAPPARPS